MATTETCKIAILMDEDGNWVVAKPLDVDDLSDQLNAGSCIRHVDLVVTMSRPVPNVVHVTAPDEAGTITTAEVT